ncbi:MAG: 4Fe-4S binding protein [Mycoplasmataceae bacterium]|jgi:formate hydrogenlyase subunit 6/NADH:ubiquinone oxidoreductase subunit I|nr:4Fe-4S binding protein [Mycoplasmataceae bacterium]
MRKAKVNIKICIGCGGCASVCPKNAISLKKGKSVIDLKKCIGCGNCTNVCPTEAIELGEIK